MFNGKYMVHAAEEDRILNWLVKDKNESDLLLMHHRFPTSTINVRKAAHPFTTGQYFGDTEYILIHNGHITNDHELMDDHEQLGITYQSVLDDGTFNDSEALLWDFALFIEGKQKELTAYGNIAFICIKRVKGKLERMYFGRNNNPLNYMRDDSGMILSSEGEGELIEADRLYNYNYELNRLTSRKMEIKRWSTTYTSGYQNQGKYNGGYWDDERDVVRALTAPGWLGDGKEKWDAYLKSLRDEEQDTMFEPTYREVEYIVDKYINKNKGNYEKAWLEIDSDLQILYRDPYSASYDVQLLEQALDLMEMDPQYVDSNSVKENWEDTTWHAPK